MNSWFMRISFLLYLIQKKKQKKDVSFHSFFPLQEVKNMYQFQFSQCFIYSNILPSQVRPFQPGKLFIGKMKLYLVHGYWSHLHLDNNNNFKNMHQSWLQPPPLYFWVSTMVHQGNHNIGNSENFFKKQLCEIQKFFFYIYIIFNLNFTNHDVINYIN